MTILLLAGAALAAVAAFRKTPEGQQATEGETTMVKVRRSTSVVLALAEAVWTVLDALMFITGRRVTPVNPGGATGPVRIPPFGNQPGSDVRT